MTAAGGSHTVLLRDNGTAVAFGRNLEGQCDIPALADGLTYMQAAAGAFHTVLLRSDGTAVAFGGNRRGQCEVPELAAGLAYVAHLMPSLLLQASLEGDSMRFVTFGGIESFRTGAGPADRLADIFEQLMAGHRAGTFGHGAAQVDAVLPGGQLLSGVRAGETVASVFGAG